MVDLNIEVKDVYRLNGDSKLKAFADVAVASLFLIKGLRIVEGKEGLFVDMPRKQAKDGQWYPTIYPLSEEAKNQLTEIVLQTYREE